MLILYRNHLESINIGNDIEVKILNVECIGENCCKHIVKLGVEAPKEIKIWRNEIFKRKMRELI